MNGLNYFKIKPKGGLSNECKQIFFICLFLFFVVPIFADKKMDQNKISSSVDLQQDQGKIISGKVTDGEGVSLPGVTVFERVSNTGAVSDIDGNFQILVTGNTTLEFSFIGFKQVIVPVLKKSWLEVTMIEIVSDLDEIVVVAYGTKSKATVTGALTTVETDELIRSPATSVVNSLAGVMPGVTTVQNSGQPGKDAAAIYVRGISTLSDDVSPLILVDGVERTFTDLDPNEIESISVLKDASSTAVFGVRGANGVVLVTTRQGTIGKPIISFSSSIGLERPDDLYQSANSYDYATQWNYMMDADGNSNKFSDEMLEAYRTGSDPIMYPSVNWSDYMFNDYYMQSRHNINISGGTKDVQYFVSFGYQYQNGLMKSMEEMQGYDNNYKNKRYNYRSNISVNLTETTTMKFNMGGVYNSLQDPVICTGLKDNLEHLYDRAFIYATRWTLPFASPGFVDGKHYKLSAGWKLLPTGFGMREGPWALFGYGYRNVNSNRINMDVDISQELDEYVKGLTVSVKGAYNVFYQTIKAWRGGQPTYYPTYTSTLESPAMDGTDTDFNKDIVVEKRGTVSDLNYAEKSSRNRDWYLEGRVNYDRSFGDHNIGALLLYNMSRNYYPETYSYIPLSYVGYVGRFTYNYRLKYLLDISMGYNGSENFAPGNTRYGFFPSVSGGWVVTEEDFVENQNIFTYLKIRGSYGQVGSDSNEKSRFLYMPETWSSGSGVSFGVDNTALESAYTQGTSGNSGVTWETATKTNLGLDVKFFENKLSVTADVFSDKREGILITPNSIPGITQISTSKLNIGKVDNKGYEVLVAWNDNSNRDFKYNISANVTYAKNKIVENDELPSQYPWQLYEGGSIKRGNAEYIFERLYQEDDFNINGSSLELNPDLPQPSYAVSPGDAKYADVSEDGVVNDLDKKVWGHSSIPEYTFGFNTSFSYKKISLFMQWTGVTNVNKMAHEGHRQIFGIPKNMGLNQMWVDNVWTPDNTDGTLPKATVTGMAWNGAESTLWDLDASYLRLKNLSLSYDLNTKNVILEKFNIGKATLALSGYNLFTFSGIDYFDPEGDDITNWSGSYPLTRIYNFTFSVTF